MNIRQMYSGNDAVIFDRHYSMTHDVQIWTPMILHGYTLFTIIVQQFGPFIQSSLFSIFITIVYPPHFQRTHVKCSFWSSWNSLTHPPFQFVTCHIHHNISHYLFSNFFPQLKHLIMMIWWISNEPITPLKKPASFHFSFQYTKRHCR